MFSEDAEKNKQKNYLITLVEDRVDIGWPVQYCAVECYVIRLEIVMFKQVSEPVFTSLEKEKHHQEKQKLRSYKTANIKFHSAVYIRKTEVATCRINPLKYTCGLSVVTPVRVDYLA